MYNGLGALAEEVAIFRNHLLSNGFTAKEAAELCKEYLGWQFQRQIKKEGAGNETN